jgi:hypothetical protein
VIAPLDQDYLRTKTYQRRGVIIEYLAETVRVERGVSNAQQARSRHIYISIREGKKGVFSVSISSRACSCGMPIAAVPVLYIFFCEFSVNF